MRSTDFINMPTDSIRTALERLLNDLQCLILKSQGVSGLCRDGDLVTWPDLLKPGGCYSPWIGCAIAAARDALAAGDHPGPAAGGEALLAGAPKEETSDEEIQQCRSVVELAHVIQGAFPLASLDAERIARAVLARWGRPAAPAAPPKEEVAELVEWLLQRCQLMSEAPGSEFHLFTRAATLLQQQAAELAALRAGVVPVAVSERPWEREAGWRDLDGECWWCPPEGPPYWSMVDPTLVYGGSVLPAHAIPLLTPQAVEVE